MFAGLTVFLVRETALLAVLVQESMAEAHRVQTTTLLAVLLQEEAPPRVLLIRSPNLLMASLL